MKLNCLLLLQFLVVSTAFAQKMYFEIKTELNHSSLKFAWSKPVEDQSDTFEWNYNFSVGISAQVYQGFYLKATAGTNDMDHLVDIQWRTSIVDQYGLRGWISMTQNYIEILPEYRFEAETIPFYLNAGVGFAQIRNSRTDPAIYRVNTEFKDEPDFPRFEGKYQYFTTNFGLILAYKKVGAIFELGYRTTGFTARKADLPGIGFRQWSFKVGLTYRLSE